MKKLLFFIIIFFIGCFEYSPIKESLNNNSIAVKSLIKQANLSEKDRIIVTTFYDIDNLEKSSKFGRTLTENLVDNFVKNKIKVYEVKLRKSVYVKRGEGEFSLTRDVHKLANYYKANHIVVGTYSINKNDNLVYVDIKIINPSNSIIEASYNYTVPLYKSYY